MYSNEWGQSDTPSDRALLHLTATLLKPSMVHSFLPFLGLSSFIIYHPPPSSFIILHHPASSFIILDHPSSSIIHYPSSSIIPSSTARVCNRQKGTIFSCSSLLRCAGAIGCKYWPVLKPSKRVSTGARRWQGNAAKTLLYGFGPLFRNLRRLLHISYSHQESARPLYSRLFQFIWQVWFLNPTSRAWTSGIECLSRAVVAPRLMGVLQCVNRTWHAKRWHKLWELWVNCFDVRWRHSKIFCKHVQIRALKRDTIHRDVF